MATDTGGAAAPAPLGFVVSQQKVDLDIDFAGRQVRGATDITIQPLSKDLRTIRLNCRQCVLTRCSVNGKGPDLTYDPRDPMILRPQYTVRQWDMMRAKVEPQLKDPPDEELVITIPKTVKIELLDPASAEAQAALTANASGALQRATIDAGPDTPTIRLSDSAPMFKPLKIHLEFSIKEFRDGLQFVGLNDGDGRYPHVYSRNASVPGSACHIFPCVDNPTARCTWEVSIRCPRTLKDAFPAPAASLTHGVSGQHALQNGEHKAIGVAQADGIGEDVYRPSFDEEEASLDLSVICSGDMTDEITDPHDHSRKTVSFSCSYPVAACHIGFAVGPFEHVDLSVFREIAQDDRLGTNAIRVHGFCLPRRADEVRNTCMPLATAIDHFAQTYSSFPFTSYKLCFVDDLLQDVIDTASLSMCSSRLLFPEQIIDPLESVTRVLVHALAAQWMGVSTIPRSPKDSWVVVGGSYFMTDIFLSKLMGKNDHRFRQKMASDKLFELDVERPSIYELGNHLALHPAEMEFMVLKAPLVFFILNQRLMKAIGKPVMDRIVMRICRDAMNGDLPDGAVSTEHFQHQCEKLGHTRLDQFFAQWIRGAGCPCFLVTQRFNKKKLVVEMLLKQIQGDQTHDDRYKERKLKPENFAQEVKEHNHNVWAGSTQNLFTGPMTIRIHEADGTPYEHIVDIKERETKVEIPYNTKYKRLKRSRRAKERQNAAMGYDASGDAQDDVLLYCLGDVLQTEQDVNDWRLVDWSKEDEERMAQESYEWIRIDKDFEWVSQLRFNQPHYMFVSQLQQDNDIVAQVESIKYLTLQRGHPLISSILTRTLMDRRYFHGIRTMAADALAKCATDELDWIGFFHLNKAFQELYCLPNSPMTRSNDFSDRTMYILQCAIPKAIAKIRDNHGKAPMAVKRFFVDKLKFNDNSNNEFSDVYYVATLMRCLAETLCSSAEYRGYDFGTDVLAEVEFQRNAIDEIERYRRLDEWIPSYKNIHSIAALRCLQRLMDNKVIPTKATNFLRYTRPGNADALQLEAFSCLVDLGLLRKPAIVKWLLFAFATQQSPYVRSKLWQIFGRGLGRIALGDIEKDAAATDGLIIEKEDPDARKAEHARTNTVDGALDALKRELKDNGVLAESLRTALASKHTSVQEFAELLELCEILYESESALLVKLKYPRYWKCKHVGEGKLVFSRTEKYRTTPHVMPDLSKLAPLVPPAPKGRSPSTARGESSPGPKRRDLSPSLKRRGSLLAEEPSSKRQTPPSLKRQASTAAADQPATKRQNTTPRATPPTTHKPPPKSNRKSLVVKLKLSSEALASFPPSAALKNPSALPCTAAHAVPAPAVQPMAPPPIPDRAMKAESPEVPMAQIRAINGTAGSPTESPGDAVRPPIERKPSIKLKLKLGGKKDT